MKELTSFYGFPERERVFEFVNPDTFIRRAYAETDLAALEPDPDTSKFVLYASQLAIAVHRSQEVRDLEEVNDEDETVQDSGIPEDTVDVGNLKMPVSIWSQLNEAMTWLDSMPVIEDDVPQEKRPEWYRNSSGRLVLNNPAVSAQIAAWDKEPEPYHPYKGYYLSIELEHLAAAIAGDPRMIQSWDEGFASRRATPDYRARYDDFFAPDFYLKTADADLRLDMTQYGEQRRRIGHHALTGILEQYGPGTRQRLAREIPRQIKADAELAQRIIFRSLDP